MSGPETAGRAGRRRVLVAALGSPLRGDDGFGPALLDAVRGRLPPGARGADFGAHGIALVQALYAGYDALVLLDACRRGGAPGTVYVMRPEVRAAPEARTLAGLDTLADAHVSDPGKALMLARALGVLPDALWLVGCEPASVEGHRLGLTPVVRRAIGPAVDEVLALLARLGCDPGAHATGRAGG